MASKSPTLSARETAVICGILCGKTYQVIAQELELSRETVKTYVTRIRTKTATQNKVTLALWAATRVQSGAIKCGNC